MSTAKNSQPTYSTPWGLNAAGRKLWDTATSDSVWAGHELAILEEACRTRDRIVQLDAAVVRDGVMISSPQGDRVHPAIAESRQQRMAWSEGRPLDPCPLPGMSADISAFG